MTFDNRQTTARHQTEEVVLPPRLPQRRKRVFHQWPNRPAAGISRIFSSGTGAGQHDLSIIDQGKVDQILQASAKDRRFIFEEAAGISRFKARKIDALRRLERVAQNLVRVQDIKDEVDKQLRSLRQQASKGSTLSRTFRAV